MIRGVKFGDYQCDKDDDLAMIAAQQYYVSYGASINMERLITLLPSYIPDFCLSNGNKTIEEWGQLAATAFRKVIQYHDSVCYFDPNV